MALSLIVRHLLTYINLREKLPKLLTPHTRREAEKDQHIRKLIENQGEISNLPNDIFSY
jgi:hypothetical protein